MKTLLLILTLLQSVEDTYKSANADFDAQRWADAAAKYEQVLKEDPSHIPSRFNLAVCYAKTGKIDEAIAAYRHVLTQNDSIYEVRLNLALLLDESGKRAEASEEYEKALALRPGDDQAGLQLATFYLRGKEYEKAYPHLMRLVEKGLGSPEILIVLSDIEADRKNPAKSREYLEKAFQLDPGNTKLLQQLASSYYLEKNYAKAIPLLQQLTKASPRDPDSSIYSGNPTNNRKRIRRRLRRCRK